MSDARGRRKPSGALDVDLTLAPSPTDAASSTHTASASRDEALTLEAADGCALDDAGLEPRATRIDLPDPKPAAQGFLAISTEDTLVLDDTRARPSAEPPSPDAEAPAVHAHGTKRRALWLAAALLAVIAALALTPLGEVVLPEPVRAPLRAATKELTDELPRLGDDHLYTFTDDRGVVHIVDDLEKIPERYRARAKRQP